MIRNSWISPLRLEAINIKLALEPGRIFRDLPDIQVHAALEPFEARQVRVAFEWDVEIDRPPDFIVKGLTRLLQPVLLLHLHFSGAYGPFDLPSESVTPFVYLNEDQIQNMQEAARSAAPLPSRRL
jgi:hypothetical protein